MFLLKIVFLVIVLGVNGFWMVVIKIVLFVLLFLKVYKFVIFIVVFVIVGELMWFVVIKIIEKILRVMIVSNL